MAATTKKVITEKEITDYLEFHKANFEEFSIFLNFNKRLAEICLTIEKGFHKCFTLEYVDGILSNPNLRLRNQHEAVWQIVCWTEEEGVKI